MFNPSLLLFIMEDDKSLLTNCNVNQLLCFILRLLVAFLPLSLSYVRSPAECRDIDNFRTFHWLRERYTFFSTFFDLPGLKSFLKKQTLWANLCKLYPDLPCPSIYHAFFLSPGGPGKSGFYFYSIYHCRPIIFPLTTVIPNATFELQLKIIVTVKCYVVLFIYKLVALK